MNVIEDTRHGRALAVNLFGDQMKICSFNCAYCDLGPTETRLNKLKETGFLPEVDEILQRVRTILKVAHERGPALNAIIVSGNGEPTLHPEFPVIIAGLIELRDLWLKEKPIAVYSNGATLDQRKVLDAMNQVDERVIKVDTGNEHLFKTVNAPIARVNLAKILSGIKGLKDVTVQSLFFQGIIDNTQSSDIEDWIEVIAILKPARVLIQGASRPTAMPGLRRCEEDMLHMIAMKLERRLGLRAHITA